MIRVVKAGLLDTIQDNGRIGYQQYGVIQSGVMDSLSSRVANLLVGNEEGEAILEMTLIGPKLLFQQDTLLAFCGGEFTPEIDGRRIPMWRPVLVLADSIVTIGSTKAGCRLVMAVAGGFDVPVVLESQSTYLKARFGGFDGRCLRKGDVLRLHAPIRNPDKMMESYMACKTPTYAATSWSVAERVRPTVGKDYTIRVLSGRQKREFTSHSQKSFLTDVFTVDAQSDRMGYRLLGPNLRLAEPRELLSEAVTFGSVQVPSNGQPIVLMADRQTTGGYPKIAQVISVDLPMLAQAKPGDRIRFQEVSIHTAQQLLQQREFDLHELRVGIELKRKNGGI